MNKQPIEMARDIDLRLSGIAMLRAAQRAHELARSTGTAIVISRDGVIEHLTFEPVGATLAAQSCEAKR